MRRHGDLDEERTKSTASPEEIEANMECVLFEYTKLPQATVNAIENLRGHIRKGCLSDIPPGCGMEKNERMHRHLNRSLLCRVATIGPELAIAALTCALYAWNCKQTGIRNLKRKAIPIMPVEFFNGSNGSSMEARHINASSLQNTAGSRSSRQTMSSISKLCTQEVT